MSEAEILTLMRSALGVAATMAAPLLVTALLVGVVIGLLQALTSIQEMTLTFVPKIAAMLMVFWLTASFLGRMVVGFWESSVLTLISA